ncbi:unnamed protein product [Lymnaea stagnalis]|uniref:Uncharacterized protein n=1 Tax=Lymnaea stagnalis TaxID=6523 RepID=A0AAV2IH24_LYMST
MLSFYRRKRKYLKNVPNSIKHETGQNKENDQQSVCLENRSPCQQGSSGDGEHLNLLAVSDNDTELKSTDSDEENHPIPIQESRSPKLCTAEEPMAEEPVINDDENEKEGKLQNNVGDNIKLQSTFSNTDNEYSFSPVSDWFSTNDHHQKQHKEKSSMYSTQRIKLKHQNKRTNFESLSKLEDNFKNEGSSSLQKRTKKRKVIHSDDFDEAEQFGFVVDSKQNFSDYYTKVLQKRYQEIMELLIKDVDDESHKKNILQETLKMSKEYDLSDITTILTKIRDAIILKFENVNV